MNNYLKRFIILLFIIILIIAFSSSYQSLSIDNLAFVVALGIDTSDTQNIKVTFEFSSASPSGESGGNEKSETSFSTVDATSLTSAINIINAYMEKKVNLSHCKIIVFSEDFAKTGISDEIYSLMNDIQVRPSANIVISKCDAKYYIEMSEPNLENIITNYYQIFPNSSEYTGYTADATIGNFFNNLMCNACEAYAILGGISSKSNYDGSTDDSIISNHTPVTGTKLSENIGLAVFKNDILVGELNSMETVCFLNLTNSSNAFLISIPNSDKTESYVDLYLIPDKKTKITVNIVNGTPYIKIRCKFKAKVYSMSDNTNYLSKEVLDNLSISCDKYLENQLYSYLYKTSVEFNSDINSFGKYSFYRFSTTKEFENFNWLGNYKNSVFDVNVETIIDSGNLLIKT